MSLYKTKSKNIRLYKHFFPYNDPADIPYRELAEKLGETPNKWRGMVRPAVRNFTIYIALRRLGYADSTIPGWFKRPPKPIAAIIDLEIATTKRSSTPHQPHTTKNAETLSAQPPQRCETQPKYVGIPKETAQRSAQLSTPERSQRSSDTGLAYTNLSDGKKYPLPSDTHMSYQPPMEPRLKEYLQTFRKQQEEQDRISQEIIYGRKKQKSPPFNVLMEQIKAKDMLQKAHNRDLLNNMTWVNLLNENRRSNEINIEKLVEELREIFKEEKTDREQEDLDLEDALKIVGDIYQKSKLDYIPDADTIITINEKRKKKQEQDKEATLDFIEKILDRRNIKHPIIEELENQLQNTIDNFFNNVL